MKRYKYLPGDPGVTLFNAVCDINNLKLAHINARRGKTWYPEVKYIDKHLDDAVLAIRNSLIYKTYHTSEYKIDIKYENGKERLIHKLPYFPDRITQWGLLQIISPIIESKFTRDTYSSIPGRGPLKCMLKVKHDMRHDLENTRYCLKIDIHKYYNSIDHDRLKQKYRKIFKDKNIIWLLDEIIDSVPETQGVPIGNYLSQYSGNLYLTDFDHWVKETMDVKYYYRYMDDMVFFSDNKEYLHILLRQIKDFLEIEKLSIKPNYQIIDVVSEGIDFVGYRIFHTHVLARTRIRNRYRLCIKHISMKGYITEHDDGSHQSYKGFIVHANSFNLQNKYEKQIEDLQKVG